MVEVIVLGGGYAGLAAAYRLGQKGMKSTVLEASGSPGGLGGCVEVDNAPIERFYHHIKPEDVDIIDMIKEFGLGLSLRWSDTRMAFYTEDKLLPFSSPVDLLRFSPFRSRDKFRFVCGVLRTKRIDGRTLDGLSAEDWVIRDWGRTVYEKMMQPMLLNKFGISPSKISAGFLHGRIKGLSSAKSNHKGGEKFAYLQGSMDRLTERLAVATGKMADIRTDSSVERIERTNNGYRVWTNGQPFTCNQVINTLPLNVFEALPKNFEFCNDVKYQGAICGIFAIKQPLTKYYWINVIDPKLTCGVVVNQSILDDYRHTLIYCGNYVHPKNQLFALSNEEVLERYRDDLEKMFGTVEVVDSRVCRTPYATPIFDRDYGQKMETLDTLSPQLHFAGNAMIYPGSRTLSTIVRTGYRAADRVLGRLAA